MLKYIDNTNIEEENEDLLSYLKVLADPKRFQIFKLLMDGVQCNCEIGSALDMAPNLITHHLNKLRAAGLVIAERDPIDSRWIYYSIDRSVLEKVINEFNLFFDPKQIQERQPSCGPSTKGGCNPKPVNNEKGSP